MFEYYLPPEIFQDPEDDLIYFDFQLFDNASSEYRSLSSAPNCWIRHSLAPLCVFGVPPLSQANSIFQLKLAYTDLKTPNQSVQFQIAVVKI